MTACLVECGRVSEEEGEKSDVSPENDGTLELEYDGGFDGPPRKEWTHEAVTILRRADRLCHSAS